MPVERKSHARIVDDQVAANPLSSEIDAPERAEARPTPPPMSSKLVSKFAIPRPIGEHRCHEHSQQSN